MQKDEGLSTRLWLEKRDGQVELGHSAVQRTVKFSLTASQSASVNSFLKAKSLQWSDLATATWCLLIDKLSTADITIIGLADAELKARKPCSFEVTKAIKSVINEELIVNDYFNDIKKQISAKKKVSPNETGAIRYLLLQNVAPRNSKAVILDVSTHPLSLFINPKKPSNLQLVYNTHLYTKDSIKQITRYFKNMLTNIIKDTEQCVTQVDFLDKREKNKILSTWSIPNWDLKIPKLNLSVDQLVDEVARQKPDSTAIVHGDDRITYHELNEYSNRIAKLLIANGANRQSKIALIMDRTPLLIQAMIGIFKSGCVFVPINNKYPQDRIEFVLDDSDAALILATDKKRVPEKFQHKMLLLPKDWKSLTQVDQSITLPKTKGNDVAYIIYTSGTTGRPKGVMIQHDSLTNLTAWYGVCLNINASDRASQFASQGFDTYMCETAPILGLGASIHIVDDNIKLTPNLFFNWLQKSKITILDLPTSYALMLFDMKWPENISVKLAKIGGEACTRYPDQSLPFDIWNIYGPTETTIEATYQKIYTANSLPNKNRKNETPAIGKIMGNCQAYIVDPHMQLVPEGVAGELLIGGVCVSPGYLNREELTEAKFIENPFVKNATSKLYRTGDLVKWLPDGNIAFVGRKDNQVKIRGYRIELGDIENALSKYPDVSEVAVVTKEAMNGEKTIIAYVVPNLDRERYSYTEPTLLSIKDDHFIEAISEDISKHGIALSGITEKIEAGTRVKLHIKLPGFNEAKDLHARLVWQIDNRAGFAFDLNEEEQATVSKCIDYFLAEHNVMDLLLTAKAKRSLKKALSAKLPEYMVPTSFVTLTQLPLTFSGKIDLKALPSPDDSSHPSQKKYIAPKTRTEKKITAIWESLLTKKKISMGDNFFDLGGTSLTAAELSVKITQQFGISIPAKILFDLSYVPILAQYIDSNGQQYSTESVIQEDIKRDCILHENITPTENLGKDLSNPKSILLTGAGGFLGIFMLNELLKATDAKIYCLVRKGAFESAAKKIAATIEKFGLQDEMSLSNRRIIAVPSDLSLNDFGLPLEQYRSMAENVDLVYHCGAQVNIMAAYGKLRGSNVKGTLEVIKFATHLKDKPIHYISTLSSAYLKDESGALTEEFPTDKCDDLFGGYAISKWVSENLLTKLKDRGFPVSIYRSGYISGRQKTGVTSLNDALLLLIKGCIQLGYAPDMREKVTILPVDFVGRAIVAISLAKPDATDVYHVDHPTGIMWTDLVAWLNDYGYPVKITTTKKWKAMLQNLTAENVLFPFIPFYLTFDDNHVSANVINDKATKVLQSCSLPYPRVDDNLLSTLFDFLTSEGFLSAPKQVKSKAKQKEKIKI